MYGYIVCNLIQKSLIFIRLLKYLKNKVINFSITLSRIVKLIFLNGDFPHELITYLLIIYAKTYRDRPKFRSSGTHTLCLKDGILYSSGDNSYGQLLISLDCGYRNRFIKTPYRDVIDIDCGSNFSVAQSKDGNLYGIGSCISGQFGLSLTKTTQLVKLPIVDVLSFSCGNFFILVQTKIGLFSCGNNDYGCLGVGRAIKTTSKFLNIDITDVISFRCSLCTVFILTKNGLFSHGFNGNGQLGLHDFDSRFIPTKISIQGVLSYSNGSFNSLVLTTHGLYFFNKRSHKKIEISNLINYSCSSFHIYLNTLDGLYYMDIGNYKKKRIYNKDVVSITSSNESSFIDTLDECYGIGKDRGELGTEEGTPNEPSKIVFFVK